MSGQTKAFKHKEPYINLQSYQKDIKIVKVVRGFCVLLSVGLGIALGFVVTPWVGILVGCALSAISCFVASKIIKKLGAILRRWQEDTKTAITE